MSDLYHDGNRRLQDQFETRKLADRIEERIVSPVIRPGDKEFIERMDMFFLATADEHGKPQCSYKGGDPGFVRVLDEHTIAFMDINPVNPGHALAVAKGHWPTVDVIPPDALGAVARTAQRIARAVMMELRPAGVNLLQANGTGAGQSVPHLHIHIMPRRPNDGLVLNWQPKPGDKAEIEAICKRLKAAL